MNLVQEITKKFRRKPSSRAQLIALPNAVMVYTAEGSIIVTTQLARDIQANLDQVTRQAEEYKNQSDKTTKG